MTGGIFFRSGVDSFVLLENFRHRHQPTKKKKKDK